MPDAPWKAHERAVAKHFGTTRELRGADFSISDCDVLVNIEDWYEGESFQEDCDYTHIVVECKYNSNLKLQKWMRDFSGTVPKSKTPVLFWDSPGSSIPEYGICWMKDFNDIWREWMHRPDYSLYSFAGYWTVGYIKRQVPKYLESWWNQAYDYCLELQKPPEERDTNFRASDKRVLRQECVGYPLVSVRANKVKGRLMVWKLWWEPPE